MKLKSMVVAALSAIALTVSAAVTPGEVTTNFAEAKEYAVANNIPLVVFWGNTGCSHCNSLQAVINSSSKFKSWMKEHPIVFVAKHEEYGSKDSDYLAAKEWIESIEKLSGYPFVGMYWKKSDGTVVQKAFTGRKGQMPVTTPKNDLEGQFVGTLDKYFADYKGGDTPEPTPTPSASGDASFVTLDTEEDRLEAVAGEVTTVFVPVSRETSTESAANILRAEFPSGKQSITFNWSVGQTSQAVPVVVPSSLKAGKKVALSLCDSSGNAFAESAIFIVEEPENHPTNPHWVGEFSASQLPYGEWTMDYETAKSKLASQGGYMVAVFTGVKWCPHCIGIDDSLFDDKKFYSWAKKNRVILVVFDQPRFNSAEGCQYVGPRLLSYNNDFEKSGASYLSRNGLNGYSDEVTAMTDLQWELTQKWLAPESTAKRLSNPTVLLLDSTGNNVAARMKTYELDDRSFPTEENLNRFSDLLLLVRNNEKEGYRTVSPLALEAGSATATELQINDSKKFFALNGVKAGEYVKIAAASASKKSQPIAVSIYAGSEVICSGTGLAITDSPITSEDLSKGLSVNISSFAESTEYGAKTSFDVLVAAEVGNEEMMRTVAFASLSKAEQLALNPALYSKVSATIPVYESVNLGGKRLAGTVTVSTTTKNKISAKFVGESSASLSGTWDEINLMSGVVSTSLAKGSFSLALRMNADGAFEASVTDGIDTFSGSTGSGDLSKYIGAYTVTLVEPSAACGTGSLTIKIAKGGKATVKGTMPDGTAVSLSSLISVAEDGTATLPVFKVTKKSSVSIALAIDPDAESTWGNEGFTDSVKSVAGCQAIWDNGDEIDFQVYGGFWKNGATPLDICELYDLSSQLTFRAGDKTDTVTAVKNGFKLVTKNILASLSFAKGTGEFSGKAKVVNSQGKTVSASVKGVLLPGWIDCGCTTEPVIERPYGSGTMVYADVVNGKKVSVSVPVDLEAVAK